MRKLSVFGFFVLLGTCNALNAQYEAMSGEDDVLHRLNETIGYYLGTIRSLNEIEAQVPELKYEAFQLRTKFKNEYEEAWKNLEVWNKFVFGPEFLSSLSARMDKEYADLYFDADNSRIFLNDVKQRLKGEIPEQTLKTLLYFKYIHNPQKEIADAHYEWFNTKSHPKSTGLEIKLKVPQSFKLEEGDRPHIVQRFREMDGDILGAIHTLLINQIPSTEGEQDVTLQPEWVSKEWVVEMLEVKPADVLSYEKVSIDGIPFAAIECKELRESTTGSIETTSLRYLTVFKNRMIMLSFSNTSTANLSRNRMLYKTIAGSMVFMDKWK
jgi:hypothetical protein